MPTAQSRGGSPVLDIRRRDFIALVGGAGLLLAAKVKRGRAQEPAMPVIGFLHGGAAEPYAHLMTAFRQGLNDGGYVEHRNVAIEYRWAEGRTDRLVELAAELVRRRVAIIVATPGGAVSAAKAATSDIPIVFATGTDPVSAGFVASLNQPGGNATGVYTFITALAAKRLGLLRELVPTARRIAMFATMSVGDAAFRGNMEAAKKDAQAAAAAMGLAIDMLGASTSREIDAAFATLADKRPDALLVNPSPLYISRRVQIVSLAMRDRLPAIYPLREFAEVGGLMTYGTSQRDEYRKMGVYAGRILKGAKPADLPVEQSTKFEFIINLQTARALGLDVPPTLLARADEVIE
jgi:putative ABC transport system substrate-binding protein